MMHLPIFLPFYEGECKMQMTNFSPFDLKLDWLESKGENIESFEGFYACHHYGKTVGEMLP
jgi:hypothetical protein